MNRQTHHQMNHQVHGQTRDHAPVPAWMVLLAAAAAFTCMALPSAHAQVIVIKNATVHTEPGKVIEGATVLVRDGVVRSVGKGDVAIPRGARLIDGTGKVVTAGFVAADTLLGMIEVSLEDSSRRGLFSADQHEHSVHAAYDVRDSYNPMSVAIPVTRAQGVTSAVVAPHGGLVSGTSSWFSLADGRPRDVLVKSSAAMYAPIGQLGDAADTTDGSGWLALTRLRELLDDARVYGRDKRAYDRNQTRSLAASRLDLEALQPVLQGRTPLVLGADRASDIEAGLRLAKDFGVRVIIEGGAEAWLVADQLAEARVGVLMNPENNLPDHFDAIHVRDDAAKLLSDAGVAVAICPLGSVHNAGALRQLAGMAVANGMTHDNALAAVTTVPARLFGVDRGTIATGKVADLVVWSGDPFELSTRAEHVIIGGVEQDLRTRQTRLFERYRKLPKK